jgi:hypothetical protein
VSLRSHAIALLALFGVLAAGVSTAEAIAARTVGATSVLVVLDPRVPRAAADVLAATSGRLVGTRLGGAVLELRFDGPFGDAAIAPRSALFTVRAGGFVPALPGCAG